MIIILQIDLDLGLRGLLEQNIVTRNASKLN